MASSPALGYLLKAIFRGYKLVTFIWLTLLVVSAPFALKFLRATSLEFEAPPGTPGYEAQVQLDTHFPSLRNQAVLTVLLTSPNDIHDSLVEVTEFVNSSILASSQGWRVVDVLADAFLPKLSVYDLARSQLTTPDNRSSLIVVTYISSSKQEFAAAVRACIEGYEGHVSLGVTGYEALFADIHSTIEQDLTLMDTITIPLALLVFWLFLGNVRLLILPLLNIATSVILSFALMYPVAIYMLPVSSIAPTLMMSVILALSTDYCLFLLTRFNEEQNTQADVDPRRALFLSIGGMIYHAGHIITASGMTLLITFLSLLLYPCSFLQSLGAGISMALLTTILVNLFLTPAIMLLLSSVLLPPLPCFKISSVDRGVAYEALENLDLVGQIQVSNPNEYAVRTQGASYWFRWALYCSTPAKSVIVIFACLCTILPVAYFATKLETTTDMDLIFPTNSNAMSVLTAMQESYPPGLLAPYQIQVSGSNVWSPEYFKMNNELIAEIVAEGFVPNDSNVLSLTNIEMYGQKLTFETASALEKFDCELCTAYKRLTSTLLSANKTSGLTRLSVAFDPLSRESEVWIQQMRSKITIFEESHPNFTFSLSGGAIQQVDLVSQINSEFPYMVMGTCGVLFLLVGLIFKSILLPLRGILTIGLSVLFTFGLSVLYFQYYKGEQMFWLGPIMSFSMLVGLGLDYDIFLISRIIEFRSSGYSTHASVVKGVYLTGSIITGAGMIMTIAFCGLLFSHIELLRQFGVILTGAVLLDTFIVRTALVPAIMQLIGDSNFWPGNHRVNDPEKTIHDFIHTGDETSCLGQALGFAMPPSI